VPAARILRTTTIEQIPVKTNDNRDSNLAAFAGKVRLVVNVASKCGLTPQYAALEQIYRRYADHGFEILAFPANDFGAQEPGTDQEIREFRRSRYDCTFPLFSKIVVKGASQHPLYAALTREQPIATDKSGSIAPGASPEISWNFEKFLIDRRGNVVARFAPGVTPDSPLVTRAIEQALGAEAGR
jgi:glutathione peroxidase